MNWIWCALLGGFVLIIILIGMLLYQPKNKDTNIQKTEIEKSTFEDEDIDQEVEDIDLGDLESDFKEVDKDINQL